MMRLIKRNLYLDKLINMMNKPDIKEITGVSCAGKSKLLDEFKAYIVKFEDIKEYHKLMEYAENNYNSKKHNFLFIDEVQMCDSIENNIFKSQVELLLKYPKILIART